MSRQRPEDMVGRGLGVAVALGALALGVAAALMNSERTRQMRDDLRHRVDDLGRRVDEAVRLLAEAGFAARVEESLGAPFGYVVAQTTDGAEVVLTVV